MNAPPSLRWITKLINNGLKHGRRQTLRAAISGGRTYRPQVEVLEDRVTPSNFNVTDLSDTRGSASDVTLRYAITNAADGDTVTFASGGTITLNNPLTIRTSITITGPDASPIAIDGGGVNQVFVIPSGITASISDLTIQHGSATDGGGVYNSGTLTLNDDVITNNAASGSGGGIYNYYGGSLTLANSTLSDNTANWGGGVTNLWTLTLNNDAIINNAANDGGGGINNANSVTHIADCTLSDNTATLSYGGAIFNSSTLSIDASTIANNSTQIGGGAIYTDNSMTISNSTLFGNSTYQYGGGILTFSTLSLTNDTITENTTTDLSLFSSNGGGIYGNVSSMDNTIVAGNSTGDTSGLRMSMERLPARPMT